MHCVSPHHLVVACVLLRAYRNNIYDDIERSKTYMIGGGCIRLIVSLIIFQKLYADQLRVIVGHLDVMGAPGVQAASLSPSVSHDMESYMKSRDDNFLQLIQNSNPFDAQPPMVFYPEQSSHLTNLLERKYSNGYSTDL
uniref:Uncharacterized protein n=1 Tax=Populus trichocarpa TaxID=3694 RepID=A0A2K2C1E9_POPTR